MSADTTFLRITDPEAFQGLSLKQAGSLLMLPPGSTFAECLHPPIDFGGTTGRYMAYPAPKRSSCPYCARLYAGDEVQCHGCGACRKAG